MGTVIFVLIEVILLALYGIAQWIKPSEVYLDNKGMAIITKRYVRMTVKGNGIIEKELKNGDEVYIGGKEKVETQVNEDTTYPRSFNQDQDSCIRYGRAYSVR